MIYIFLLGIIICSAIVYYFYNQHITQKKSTHDAKIVEQFKALLCKVFISNATWKDIELELEAMHNNEVINKGKWHLNGGESTYLPYSKNVILKIYYKDTVTEISLDHVGSTYCYVIAHDDTVLPVIIVQPHEKLVNQIPKKALGNYISEDTRRMYCFPDEWENEKIKAIMSDAYDNLIEETITHGRYGEKFAYGISGDLIIRLTLNDEKEEITNAYPCLDAMRYREKSK